MRQRIHDLLEEAFHPQSLEVVDESHLHAGHAGWRPGGGTHFRVTIVAEAFRSQPRVARHRMVFSALASVMQEGVHALALTARAPEE